MSDVDIMNLLSQYSSVKDIPKKLLLELGFDRVDEDGLVSIKTKKTCC